MATQPDLSPTRIFLAGACSQSLLTPEVASAVSEEAESRGISASQLVVEKGLMDAVQVDIVETLLRPEQTIPTYEILNLIGRGGMGIVYRARQKNLNRIVAIKTVLIHLLSQSGAVARFEKEAQAVARFRHPNIVTAYDFGRHAGRLYLVMELLEGQTLETLINRKGRLSEQLAWGLIRQAAGGLAHAAEARIVHRDIKPANLILIDPPAGFTTDSGMPMVKITDFGLALLTGDPEQTGRITIAGFTLGTPVYMAPEQISSSEVDCRADIYSLGVTAFHMLTGRPPFEGENLWEILAAKSKGADLDFDRLRAFASPASVALVRDMTAHLPSRRISDYRELIARIDRLDYKMGRENPISHGEGAPVAVAASKKGRLGKRTLRRSHLPILGSVAVVLVVVAAFVVAKRPWQTSLDAHRDRRQMVSSGNIQNLFTGTSLAGWLPIEGAWIPARDAEGGLILSGRGGMRRPLPSFSHFRITMGLDLHQSEAAEVHFGVESGSASTQPRYVMRVTKKGTVLGYTEGDRGALNGVSGVLPYTPVDAENGSPYREVRIERQEREWSAFYDGKLVGNAPLSGKAELPEFRLFTESGPAFFDAVTIEELVLGRSGH
jgi:serine/threonine protein kinase